MFGEVCCGLHLKILLAAEHIHMKHFFDDTDLFLTILLYVSNLVNAAKLGNIFSMYPAFCNCRAAQLLLALFSPAALVKCYVWADSHPEFEKLTITASART